MSKTTTNSNLILIVDDVEQNVAVLSNILRTAGYTIMASFSGEQALRLVEKRKPDLIVLDVMMPGIDGYETCTRLKRDPKLADIPVLFLSALSDSAQRVKGLQVGGVDFISKPFHEEEVVARVGVHVRIKNLEREQENYISQLERMNREKDRLMSIVSHDLRSPLGGIIGLSRIMSDGNEEILQPQLVKKYSTIITQSAETLVHLVNDLLDIAKIEQETDEKSNSEFNLVDVAQNTIDILRYLATQKGLSIQSHFTEQSLIVEADKVKINQVLSNLITNGIKFTKEGGVTVDISSSGTNVTMIISDTGIGIPKADLPYIFDKFGNSQRRGTNNEKGTGLGMHITQYYVALHGGSITVSSEENVGTTYKVTLPIAIQNVKDVPVQETKSIFTRQVVI
jgi:two-component system, sensor histidine kinase and response regulator